MSRLDDLLAKRLKEEEDKKLRAKLREQTRRENRLRLLNEKAKKDVQQYTEVKVDLQQELDKLKERNRVKLHRKHEKTDAVGAGFTKKDLKGLFTKARFFLSGPAGAAALEAEIQHRTLVALMIEGIYGTELWRMHGTGMAGRTFAAGNRARFIDSATRLLTELRQARESRMPAHAAMLDGVLDTQMTAEPHLEPLRDRLIEDTEVPKFVEETDGPDED